MRKESNWILNVTPPVIAHRGASMYAPENTLASFSLAQKLNIQWLEFDVRITADHQVVIMHDETLERTTDSRGTVFQHPYHYLASLDAGSWFDDKFKGQKIPLFRDVICFLHEHNMAANVEIKSLIGNEALTAELVLNEINNFWPKHITPPLISSFSFEVIAAIRELDQNCWVGLLLDTWREDWEKLSQQFDCVSVHLSQHIADPERIAAIKASKRSVFCYTVNTYERARELFSWGVDAVYSDCPDKIAALTCHDE